MSSETISMHYEPFESPIGELLLLAEPEGLVAIRFEPQSGVHDIAPNWTRGAPVLEQTAAQLREYFAGRREVFDLPLCPPGTEFMQRVWKELCRIPFGTTISYGELATRIGNPKASRAVGMANGKNPIPIVVPCHRVIGSNGRLTGFAGGLEVKEQLLRHEASSPESQGKLFDGALT